MDEGTKIVQVVAQATPPSSKDEKEMNEAWLGLSHKGRRLILITLMANPEVPDGDPDELARDDYLIDRQPYELKMCFWAVYKGYRDLTEQVGVSLNELAEKATI